MRSRDIQPRSLLEQWHFALFRHQISDIFWKMTYIQWQEAEVLLQSKCFCPPTPSFLSWNLTPNVIIFGRGVFGRYLGHEVGALINKISTLIKETPQNSLALLAVVHQAPSVHEDTARRQLSLPQEMSPHQTLNHLAPWSWTSSP